MFEDSVDRYLKKYVKKREKNGQNQGPFISSCYPDSGYGAVLQAPIYVETDVNKLMIYLYYKMLPIILIRLRYFSIN